MVASGRTVDIAYDAAGRELTRRTVVFLTLNSTYDARGRLVTQSAIGPNDRTLQRRAYAYRGDGHLAVLDDQLNGRRSFDLDAVGRVTAVRAEGWTETYAYDAVGNQTHASWPAPHPGQEATGDRTYSGTRITHAGHVRYEHDALGRITLRQKTRLSRQSDHHQRGCVTRLPGTPDRVSACAMGGAMRAASSLRRPPVWAVRSRWRCCSSAARRPRCPEPGEPCTGRVPAWACTRLRGRMAVRGIWSRNCRT